MIDTNSVLETIAKMVTIVAPVMGGLAWVAHKNSKGQRAMLRAIGKLSRHKVSYKDCDKRRRECPCRAALKGGK